MVACRCYFSQNGLKGKKSISVVWSAAKRDLFGQYDIYLTLKKHIYLYSITPLLPLEVLGIQLGWDAQDAVIDGGDVSQLLLLCLPVDEGLPQAV